MKAIISVQYFINKKVANCLFLKVLPSWNSQGKCPLWMERAQVWGKRHNGKDMLNILNRKLRSTGQQSRENFGSLGGCFTSAFHLGSARVNKQANAHS